MVSFLESNGATSEGVKHEYLDDHLQHDRGLDGGSHRYVVGERCESRVAIYRMPSQAPSQKQRHKNAGPRLSR